MVLLFYLFVKGTIDQVAEEITLPWVQPRVLDLTQVTMIYHACGYFKEIGWRGGGGGGLER